MTLVPNKRPGPVSTPDAAARYGKDAYAWAIRQADMLPTGRVLDPENLADEIADATRGEYDELEGASSRILQHLLRWDHQPDRRSPSWTLSVREHRRWMERRLRKHQALCAAVPKALDEAYGGCAGSSPERDRLAGDDHAPPSAIRMK